MFLNFIKKYSSINPSLGKYINLIPFSKRPLIGRDYRINLANLNSFEIMNVNDKKNFIFNRIKNLVNYSYKNVFFYKNIYDKNNFSPSVLKKFDDINRIPIISKNDLNNYSLDERTSFKNNSSLVNTGGSSGNTLSLYIPNKIIGNEWSHMHKIWSKLNYNHSDFKLVFAGRSSVKNFIQYDFVRNQFSIDIYSDYSLIAPKLKKILLKYEIKYLHGYPSAIYIFAQYCSYKDQDLLNLLKKNLKGILFSSEFPHFIYRDFIENVFKVKSISWYGHTERAILAYEKDQKEVYCPFQSYGYAECYNNLLVGTSYYNFNSPIIRYNTSDIINDCKFDNDILTSFKISEGRVGEFVVDFKNNKISLTSLIFGRHHELFNYASFIQIKQEKIGFLKIFYVSQSVNPIDAENLFDSQNLNFILNFEQLNEPIRTVSGKINLLIN
jgi:phenylacetate-CoA ligase